MSAEPSVQVSVGATEARSHFADMLKRVNRSREHLIIEKDGIPVAALIALHEYNDFRRWRAKQELRGVGQAMAEQAKRAGLEEEDLAEALEADRCAVHDMHYRQQAGE